MIAPWMPLPSFLPWRLHLRCRACGRRFWHLPLTRFRVAAGRRYRAHFRMAHGPVREDHP